jgi:hypothetical protein
LRANLGDDPVDVFVGGVQRTAPWRAAYDVPELARAGECCLVRRAEALLHKSADGQATPFPGDTYPTALVTGMPSAVKPFMTATRI